MNNFDKALGQKGGMERCKMKRLNDYRMRLVIVGFIVSGFLSTASVCSAVEYIWTQKTDIPTPRWRHTSAVVDGKIYVIGGTTDEPNPELVWPVEVYNPTTDAHTRKTDMPLARTVSTSVVNGKIYAIGGTYIPNGSTSDVEEYDPATDTWTRKADMPTPRRQLATCVINGKIYAIGGLAGAAVQGLRAVEEYDPSTDTWAKKLDMPIGLWALSANVVDGNLYVLGGRPGYTAIPNVYEYDPATDTWKRKADMPIATSQMASVVLGDKIVVIGGWHWSNDFPYTAVQVYDPETDIWTIETDAPFLRACFSASVVNNRIYAIGGTDRPHPCPATSTVYEFGPLLDFNWDGIVDATDVCMMIDYWGTDEPLYDIAPPPFGDSIIDGRDLIELAEHLFTYPGAVAYWTLDETEGDTANDSVGNYNGTLVGNPIWQPNDGIVGGALQFDGVDDYVSTDLVLNPADGAFSIFAWIKGGAPGQVIISQADTNVDTPRGPKVAPGSTWLGVDASFGTFMTGLGQTPYTLLVSESVITDAQWHRIGLVYDAIDLRRYLYVDGIEVGADADPANT